MMPLHVPRVSGDRQTTTINPRAEKSDAICNLYTNVLAQLEWTILRADLIQFRRFRRDPLKFDISRTKTNFKNPFDKF